jgi:hypothetical protein
MTYNIVGEILFSQSLLEIQKKFESLRKDSFSPQDRIVIQQDIVDEYPYVDAVGTKLIEIQKIINQIDISNCFVLLVTANKDVAREIDFVTRFYSVDPNPLEFQIVDGHYEKKVKRYSNTACKKLWKHFYVGTDGNVNPCCVADHRFPLGHIDNMGTNNSISDNVERIRQVMTDGYRDRACSACYEKEDRGLRNERQICDPSDMEIGIKDVDIRLNNICNFKCRMCSEYFSSAIQQETVELYGKNAVLGFEKISLESTSKQIRKQRLEKILTLITPDLDSIYFAGGEPLIINEHYEILDQLIAVGNTDLTIRYNTNLSKLSYKNINVIDRWRQFSDITVGASIDASGAAAKYMRHGTVWNDIVHNIHAIKQHTPHVKLQISSTVSAFTIENLIDLQCAWMDQQLFSVEDLQVSVLTSPNFFSPAMLPPHHKDRLSSRIRKHMERVKGTLLASQWNDVLQWMLTNDYTFALNDFKHRTRVLDAHRHESFVDVFPEFKDLYEF